LNSPRGKQVCNLLIQEGADSGKVRHVGLFEMRKGVLIVDDFQNRNSHEYVVCKDAGADQWKVRLAFQAPLECLELPVGLRVALGIAPLVPAPKQRSTLRDDRAVTKIEHFEPGLRTEPQEFPHLVAFRGEARALIAAKPVDHQDVVGMAVVFGDREPFRIELSSGDFGNELQPRLEIFPARQIDQGFDRFVDAAIPEERIENLAVT
jgi:hypothetical protein